MAFFYGQNHTDGLKYFIDTQLGIGLVLDDCDHAVSGDGGVDLDADSILCLAPEPLDVEVLLHPFEEQFNLPSAFVKVRNFQSIKT